MLFNPSPNFQRAALLLVDRLVNVTANGGGPNDTDSLKFATGDGATTTFLVNEYSQPACVTIFILTEVAPANGNENVAGDMVEVFPFPKFQSQVFGKSAPVVLSVKTVVASVQTGDVEKFKEGTGFTVIVF